MIENINLWDKYFPSIKPYYAMKCNNYKPILQELIKYKFNFDCASIGEIKFIKSLKYTNNHVPEIIFANPIKINTHIESCKQYGVVLTTLDGIEEFDKITKIDTNMEFLLRLKSDDSFSVCKLNSKFGIEDKNIHNFFEYYSKYSKSNKYPIFKGVSFHVGSNCKSSLTYKSAINNVIKQINYMKQFDLGCSIVNVGGGFIKNHDILREVSTIFSEFQSKYKDIVLIAEPGRFIVEDIFDLYTKVIGTNNNKYYINNSIYSDLSCILFDHKILEYYIILNDRNLILKPLNSYEEWIDQHGNIYKSKKIILFGHTCDSFDVISNSFSVPELFSCNDIIKFLNMGAYTYTSRMKFNGFDCAKIQHASLLFD